MSTEKETGGPAFPGGLRGDDDTVHPLYEGMSLRDYYAGKAMQGILAGPCSREGVPISELLDVPRFAYQVADSMLEARKK